MTAKILVVDDHPDTLAIITMTLQRQGYEVFHARSGEQGLKIAQDNIPNLILLDIMMPDMDGLEVCRRIRANPRLSSTPVVMFSAMSRAEDKLAGFAAGADDYLVKPTRPKELLRRVQAILDRSDEVRQIPHPPPAAPRSQIIKPAAPRSTRQMAEQDPSSDTSIRPTMPGGQRFIGVVGACGGVGATTTAVNLAVGLADAREQTLLMDLHIQGHVALHLGWKNPDGINVLTGLQGDAWDQQLKEQTILYSDSLQLLLARPNFAGNLQQLSDDEIALMLDAVLTSERVGVADLGSGLTPRNLPVLERVSDVVICLRPDRVAILAAKHMVEHLRDNVGLTVPIHLLLLSFTGKSNFPRPVIEDFLGHSLVEEINIPASEVTKAVNKGLPLVRANEALEASQRFQQLAHQFVRVPS